MGMGEEFWDRMGELESQIKKAKTVDEVLALCQFDEVWPGSDGTFPNDGDIMLELLQDAGWTVIEHPNDFQWLAEDTAGALLSFEEGHLYRVRAVVDLATLMPAH